MRTCDHAQCIVQVTLLSVVFCIAIGLNSVTLLAFFRRRSGRRPSGHRFLLSLTLCNLAIALLVLPMYTYWIVYQAQPPGMVFAGLTAYLVGVTVLNVLLIGWDRFLACARNPLFYNRNMSYRRSVVFIVASWIIPAVVLSPAMLSSTSEAAEIKWRLSSTTMTSALIFAVGNYFLPLLALTAIYTKVFCAAKSSTSSQGRKNLVFEFDNNFALRRSLTADLKSTNGTPFSRQNSTSSFQSFITGQERQKAAHIIIWILITFVALYSLYFTEILIQAFFPDVVLILPASFHQAIHVLYFFGTIINPVLYILCNSGLRRDIRRVFMRQEEIRRQTSLQLQAGGCSRHASNLWHSASESRCFARQQSLDVSPPNKSFSSPVMLPGLIPLITCTSPEMDEVDINPDEDDELYFPEGGLRRSGVQRLSQSSAEEDREPFMQQQSRGQQRLDSTGSMGSSRSLSRKSVSWEDAGMFDPARRE